MKNQIKKSLSLFMAVMMLLSCWVWVAPEKAAAADYDNGKYYVKYVIGTIREAGNNDYWDGNTLTIDWVKADGTTGSTGAMALTKSKYTTQGATNITLWEGYIDGFPTSAGWYMKMGFKSAASVYLSVGDCALYVGKDAANCNTQVSNKDSFKWQQDATGQGTKDATFPLKQTAENPYAATFVSGNPALSVTIPSLGETEEKTTTGSVTAKVYDQYGVWMYNQYATGYSVVDTSSNAYNKADHGIWANKSGNSATVSVNSTAQKTVTGTPATKSATVDVHASYSHDTNGTIDSTKVATVTFSYPTYTITVDQNGSISDLGADMKISNNTTQTAAWTHTGIYAEQAATYPTGGRDAEDPNKFLGASKEGYTFKGFWSVIQPTSGDADYNQFESAFANPVDTTTFEKYCGQEGATANGNVVTLADGSKYYNAGKEWNPETDKEVLGNANYYGWWISKDVPVKFYDIDGKYLGKKTFKYGKTPAESEYLNPKDSYTAGAYEYQTFAKKWRDITGLEVIEGSHDFKALDSYTLTPIYTTKTYNDKYSVTFVDPSNGTKDTTVYNYRDIVPQSEAPLTATMENDPAYSYEFEGWSSQVPKEGNYHVIGENDTSLAPDADMIVRGDITYYAIYRSTIKSYRVGFRYTDTTGTRVVKEEVLAYGSVISTPDYANRTYAFGGKGYNLEGWKYNDKDKVSQTFGVDKTLVLNAENVYMSSYELAGGSRYILIDAYYDNGTAMPYTVNFKYKDATGNDTFISAEVYHGDYIAQGTVNKLDIPAQYDDGDALYTFANKWKVTEGTASQTEYTKDQFTSFSPTSHVTFEAVYDDGVPYHTVKYIDGVKTYTERILKGYNVPAWMVETGENDENGEPIMEEYVPADYDGDGGKFKFAGWYDEEQTDKTFKETNGTKYTTASIVEGDLNLYAQYKFEATKYIIRFMDYTGKVQLGIAEVEKGQSFAPAFYEAQRAANSRPADDTYTYTFIGWDQPYNEDNLVCEGKDVTYIAQYRANYIYYKAEWYADAAMAGDPLETTSHTYNSKLYSPSVDFTGVAPDGKVFDGWYYLKDGVETAYQRGMFITSEMKFYAKYKDATVTYTVTTVVDGKRAEYTVAKDAVAKAVPTPADGFVDATKHNKFAGWYTDAAYVNAFDIEKTAITTDITIYAKLDEEEHTKDQKNILTYPSYYAKGSEEIWCACSKATVETVEIPMLTDTVAPTGTIYLGTQGKWSSSDAQSGAADTNEYYANEDTDVILTINDTGDVNVPYNPSGKGIGIRMIRAFVSSDTFTADQQGIASQLAITIFTDNSQEQNNTANYTFKVGDLVTADLDADGNVQYEADGTTIKTKSLEDGKEYIIYYYAVDKANRVLNKNVRTAKFTYDATAPEFEITGESNAATATGTVTYCDEATVTDIETGATVTVNGEEVAFSDSTYTITEAGNYVIKVTDEAGNSSTEKIIVTDGHTEVTVEKKVTCDEDGYKKVTCAICGKTITEETTKTEGHKWNTVETKAATCNAKGYTLQQCTVCGEKQKINETDKLAHEYAKDANGDIIYTVVTKATCKAEGKKIANCTLCGAGTLTEVIPVDADAHVYGGIKILKPTCTEDGKYYQTCKYCYTVKNGETIPATGHEDEVVTVTKQATCYAAGEKTVTCKACGAFIRTESIATIAHTLKLVEYTDVENFSDEDKAAYPNGYMQYECQASGCTHTEGKEAIKPLPKFTVKFFAEGAKEGDAPLYTITKTQGDSISVTDVPDQKKNADNTYNYTFAGWKNKADGKVVNLPLTVTADAEYTAEFAKSTIIYTHIFMVPTKWVATLGADDQSYVTFASMMGKYEDTNKVPAAIPTFSDADEKTDAELKKLYTFEFSYWALSDGTKVTDFTMYGNETFYAVFEAKSIEYDVIFYSGNDYIATKTVDGGETVELIKTTDAQAADIKKAPTDTQHYSFNGNWYTDAEGRNIFTASTKIIEDTRLYAGFTAEDHSWEVDAESAENKAATCYEAKKVAYKCACGATKVEAVGEKLEHDMGEYVYNEETGYNEATCKREGCGYTHKVKASYTIKFLNENGVALISPITVKANGEATYTGETPAKAATAQYTYEFAGWLGEDGTKYAKDHKFTGIVADATYTAYYTEITRTFRVSYLDVNGKVIQTQAGIAYGAAIPAYTGNAPTKNYDDTYHYVFNKWSVADNAVVTADLAITPVFEAIEHDYDAGTVTNATCDKDGGLTKKCMTCGHSFVSKDIVPATGHKYDYNNPVVTEPNYTTGADGERRFYCKNGCGEYESEVIYAYIDLVVNVKDSNGNPREGVKVALVYANDVTKPVEGTRTLTSGADGKVTFRVRPGEYKALIDSDYIEIDVNDGNKNQSADFTQGSAPEQEAPSCSCSCHRDSLWGTIFRFFHKIIKFFTGKIRCCSCPDSRY